MKHTTPAHRLRRAARLLGVSLAVCASQGALAQDDSASLCGNPFRNHFGPFDYRKVDPDTKQLVEGAHFTPGVETMTKPSTTTFRAMAGDVGYTLHVFPNHHRALITMTRLGERHQTDMPPGAKFTVDCYYDRATRFAPDDTVVRALYARYLVKQGQRERALQQLAIGVQHAKDNALSHFNLGLVYFELGEYDLALSQAKRAKELGMPRTELIDLLKRAGKWEAPPNGTDPGGTAEPHAQDKS